MEYGTFKLWLTERGCRFDTQPEQRGDGHGTVTIHREGQNCCKLARATNLTRIRFAEFAKHSTSNGRISRDLRVAPD